MKLKKVLSGIMAAVMAVTSSVVMTVSAGAEDTIDITSSITSGMTPTELSAYSTLTVTYAPQPVGTGEGFCGHPNHENAPTYCNWAQVPFIGVVTSLEEEFTTSDWSTGVEITNPSYTNYYYQPSATFAAAAWQDAESCTATVAVSDVLDSFTSAKDTNWDDANWTLDKVFVSAWQCSVTKVEATPVDENAPTEFFSVAYNDTPVTMTVSSANWVASGLAAQNNLNFEIDGFTMGEDTWGDLKSLYAGVEYTDWVIESVSDGIAASDIAASIYIQSNNASNGWYSIDGTKATFSSITVLNDEDVISAVGFQLNYNVPTGTTWKAGDTFTINPEIYSIKIADAITNGAIKCETTEAEEGETVEFTVTANKGYEIAEVTVNGEAATGTNGAYSFAMPAEAVELSATFDAIKVEEITVTAAATSVVVGGTTKVSAKVTPEDALDTSVIWGGSDDKVALVTADGTVTAVGEGKVTITATSTDSKDTTEPVQGTVEITVTADANPAAAIALDKTEATIKMDETVTLKATVTAKDTTKDCTDSVIWGSADEKIATVKDGVVTPVALGTTTITVTAGDKTAECKITVAATPVEKITLAADPTTITVGDTMTIAATVTPDDATDKTVTWTSSDEKVATVADGKVTAVAAGKTTITATANDGSKVTATVEITVEEVPAELTGTKVTLKDNAPWNYQGEQAITVDGFTKAKTTGAEIVKAFAPVTVTFKVNGAECDGKAFDASAINYQINAKITTSDYSDWPWLVAGTSTYDAATKTVTVTADFTDVITDKYADYMLESINLIPMLEYAKATAEVDVYIDDVVVKTSAADEEEDETLDKGTYGAGTGSYKELPADEIPQMTMGKDNVETEGYTETSKAYFEDDKLFIFKCVDEAALEGKSQATVVVQHKNGKALKMTSTGVYKTLKADVAAEDGKLYVAFVISGVTNDTTADAYYGNFQWSDITIS